MSSTITIAEQPLTLHKTTPDTIYYNNIRVSAVDSGSEPLCRHPRLGTVHFNPRLADQRHHTIRNILQKEQATSILDIGCGRGDLLDLLAFQSCHEAASIPDGLAKYPQQTSEGLLNEKGFCVSRIGGLDLDRGRVDQAARKPSHRQTRCTEFRRELWHGSLSRPNIELTTFDAIVASEVIEHLNDADLLTFAPTVFSFYRPRIVVVSTPNYDFNAFFDPPVDDVERKRTRHPDPTGRTSRVFRHHDHKFEFTEKEFQDWSHQVANTYGYEVKFGGAGSLPYYPTRRAAHCRAEGLPPVSHTIEDPSPPLPLDPSCFYASQIAVFKLKEGKGVSGPAPHKLVSVLEETFDR